MRTGDSAVRGERDDSVHLQQQSVPASLPAEQVSARPWTAPDALQASIETLEDLPPEAPQVSVSSRLCWWRGSAALCARSLPATAKRHAAVACSDTAGLRGSESRPQQHSAESVTTCTVACSLVGVPQQRQAAAALAVVQLCI